jgi:hypothetical protein
MPKLYRWRCPGSKNWLADNKTVFAETGEVSALRSLSRFHLHLARSASTRNWNRNQEPEPISLCCCAERFVVSYSAFDVSWHSMKEGQQACACTFSGYFYLSLSAVFWWNNWSISISTTVVPEADLELELELVPEPLSLYGDKWLLMNSHRCEYVTHVASSRNFVQVLAGLARKGWPCPATAAWSCLCK